MNSQRMDTVQQDTSDTMSNIFVILVNYNTIEHTCECIRSIFDSETQNSIKVIIIDNASKEDVKKKIAEEFSNKNYYHSIEIIINNNNIGFGAANNIGIDYAIGHGADYILILNNDTTVDARCIEELKLCVQNSSLTTLSTAKILNYYHKDIIWYAGGRLLDWKGDAITYGLNQEDIGKYNNEKVCTFASGCCMFAKTELFNKFKLPEKYFLYYEDVDFCKTLKNNGVKIVYNPKAIVFHKESTSTHKSSALYSYYYVRNRLLYIKNNINGISKIIAKVYSYLWFEKKIITQEFERHAVKEGIKDYKSGQTGRKY